MSAPNKTFSILAAVARNQPDATAIVHQDKNLSYGDLFDAASGFAAKLAEAGLPSESVVGLIGSKKHRVRHCISSAVAQRESRCSTLAGFAPSRDG